MRGFSFIHSTDLHVDCLFRRPHRVLGEPDALFGDVTFQAVDNPVEPGFRAGVEYAVK
jgi:hypothetical protein